MLSFEKSEYKQTYTIAHRGAVEFAHENTIDAFQKAIDIGADAIELDIRKTKDDVLVVHHDATLQDYTVPIAEMHYEEISFFNSKSHYQVPTLIEVLQLCKNKIALDVELKETGYEKSVVDLCLKYFDTKNLLFSSFNHESLVRIKALNQKLFNGYLFHKPMLLRSIPNDVDYLLPHFSLNKLGYFKKLAKLEKPLIVWTVNKQKEKFDNKDIFAIISDYPDK